MCYVSLTYITDFLFFNRPVHFSIRYVFLAIDRCQIFFLSMSTSLRLYHTALGSCDVTWERQQWVRWHITVLEPYLETEEPEVALSIYPEARAEWQAWFDLFSGLIPPDIFT